MGSPKIRVKAQVLIKHDDKVLVYRVRDIKSNTHIYRLIGGRVEFGELSEKAAVREFYEETQIEVHNAKHVGCFESIYIINEKEKHEFVQIYACEFVDQTCYSKKSIRVIEGDEVQNDAEWVDAKFLSLKSTPFYPEKLKEILTDKFLENKKI
ncbi:hypothetical protein CIK05_07845 [Bdellovibrio sp. qaytius]|nr:hypothetical protein CIK05_07845 [Bdellovibrio sp. qaytius]